MADFLAYCTKSLVLYNNSSLITRRFKRLSVNRPVLSGFRIPNMNKAALVDKVHEVLGGTKVEAEKVVDTVFDSIAKSLKSGEEVSVAGFGIFEAKTRAARTARNPRTGESIKVPAMRTPKFRAAKALKDAVK